MGKKRIEMAGKTYGRWTVIKMVSPTHWLCACECGAEKEVFGASLRHGKSTECMRCAKDKLSRQVWYNGELTALPKIARDHGISLLCLKERLRRGYTIEEAVIMRLQTKCVDDQDRRSRRQFSNIKYIASLTDEQRDNKRERRRQNYKNNAEEQRRYSKEYRDKNIEKCRERERQWYKKKKNRIRVFIRIDPLISELKRRENGRKYRDELRPSYVRNVMRSKKGDIPDSLVSLKIEWLRLYREIRRNKDEECQ